MDIEHSPDDDSVPQSGSIDGVVERLLRSTAARSTRRSFFGRLGTLALVLAGGGSAASLVLTDARVHASGCGPETGCDSWKYCWMSGKPCGKCGGTDTTCPGGCTKGTSYWVACCETPIFTGRLIRYKDCCGSCTLNCNPSGACCTNSKGQPGIPSSGWCDNGLTYKCTLAEEIGPC